VKTVYPHRVHSLGFIGDERLHKALILANTMDVRVYRMSPTTWRFKPDGRGRAHLDTTTPWLVEYRHLDLLLRS
jgi:hypothetical protein